MSLLEKIYKQRFQARRFCKDNIPDKELINSLLEKAFNLVSSKQNLMPYKLTVFGPEHTELKQKFWESAAWHWEKPEKFKEHHGTIQLLAPYVIVFSDRRVNDYNPSTKRKLEEGHPYKLNLRENYWTKNMEVGMFAKLLTGLCLEKNLAVSYTLCFPGSIPMHHRIKDELVIDINTVFLFMSIGYADGGNFVLEKDECKPPIENIIEWR